MIFFQKLAVPRRLAYRNIGKKQIISKHPVFQVTEYFLFVRIRSVHKLCCDTSKVHCPIANVLVCRLQTCLKLELSNKECL